MEQIKNIVSKFDIKGEIISAEPFGNGHINTTKLVTVQKPCGCQVRYVLQRINKNVFKNPEALMKNFASVTDYLAQKAENEGRDPYRETLRIIRTKDGKDYINGNGTNDMEIHCSSGDVGFHKI